jgi:hypothetical protein
MPSDTISTTLTLDSTGFLQAAQKLQYLDLTHQLNNYNEIYNMNKYVSNVNSSEMQRLAGFNENLKSKVLKLKQDYMLYDVSMKKFHFWTNILYFTIVMTCLVFFAIAFHTKGAPEGGFTISKTIVIIIICGLALFYIAVVIFSLSAYVRRRKQFYNQFYWKPMESS